MAVQEVWDCHSLYFHPEMWHSELSVEMVSKGQASFVLGTCSPPLFLLAACTGPDPLGLLLIHDLACAPK